jgi:hypothetical protein
MELLKEEQPEEETIAAPATAQKAAGVPYAQDGEMSCKVVAPLDVLQKTGRADDGHGDEKKPRADSSAIIDHVCLLKNCRKSYKKKKEDYKGEGECLTWSKKNETG